MGRLNPDPRLTNLIDLKETPMPKHTTTDAAPFTAVLADILDLRSVRAADLDGHIAIDSIEANKIGGRVLHAHDNSELLTFGIEVTAS